MKSKRKEETPSDPAIQKSMRFQKGQNFKPHKIAMTLNSGITQGKGKPQVNSDTDP